MGHELFYKALIRAAIVAGVLWFVRPLFFDIAQRFAVIGSSINALVR